MTDVVTGFVIVDKPAGMTSHDVVSRMRRIAKTRKVGHAGTLDPMATGVLVLAVGKITRLLNYVTGCNKTYEGTIRLGMATTTDDAEGETIQTSDTAAITDAEIAQALRLMVGQIWQVPSSVSAVKIDGKRAYKRVAAGEDVTIPPRQVTISRLEVSQIRRGDWIDVDVVVECSSGTYIRAIARDLGATFEVGGHLIALRRTAVGEFTLSESATLEELAAKDTPVTHSTFDTIRRLMPCRQVDAETATRLGHGGALSPIDQLGPYAVIDPNDTVVGVVSERDGKARAEIVLAPSG